MKRDKDEMILGVLGEMGPETTVDFMSRVIALTAAKQDDQDHIRMIVDHRPDRDTRLPSYSEHYGHYEEMEVEVVSLGEGAYPH